MLKKTIKFNIQFIKVMYVDSVVSLMANIAQFSKHNIQKLSKLWWWGGGGTSARKLVLSRYNIFRFQIFS